MPYISEGSILEVKNAVDLVEVVSGYLPLKRKGSSYWAACPFHDEKTASFHVVPDKQFYKCFGCGAHGGVLDFVQKFEKIDFPAAVSLLAEKAGIALRYEGPSSSGPRREDLVRVQEWAAEVFRKQLLGSAEAEPARRFLERRGISPQTAEAWRLGWALDAWDGLITRARIGGFDEKLLVAAGLAVERDSGGVYDRFRGRVVFPIFDIRGKVIAFGARSLKDEPPKFINSPETLLFQKGRQLFGFHRAKEEVEEGRTLYIVEGYIDVIVPWQAGVRCLVATLGTALTREHLRILKRYVDRVVLVFDSDAAGQKAAERGLDLLLSEDMDLFVAKLPPGEDADDVVRARGAGALREILDRPQEMFAFLLESLSARIDLSTPNGRVRLATEVLERIARIPNEIKQDVLIQETARRFGFEERLLRAQLRREGRPPAPPPPAAKPAASRIGLELLSLLLNDADAAARIRHEVPAERYPHETARTVAEKAYELYDRAGAVTGSDLLALVRDEEAAAMVTEAMAAPFDVRGAARQLEDCLEYLGNEEFRSRAKSLKGSGEEEALERLIEERRRAPRNLRALPKPQK
ncbi:MAG: DNA primase [Planctomycetes bacterium]|nr:DNA primase [Planctomycetota bacterium]